jgi:hypothetical protein
MEPLSHVEFLVEEPSAEAALDRLVPRILGSDVTFKVYRHSGKSHLLRNLGNRLRGYRSWLPSNWGIVVLVDRDHEDCRELKRELEDTASAAGLLTPTMEPNGSPRVLNRLAIEELEAWFFGDVAAICAAYPGVPPSLGEKARYREPDAIAGGTAEALERVLMAAGHHRGGLAKIRAAREIASHMVPERNRSRSFQVFRQGLLTFTRRAS